LEREKKILQELVKARKAVKRKYDLLKSEKDSVERAATETFKPITLPLEQLVKEKKMKREKYSEKLIQFPKKETKSQKVFDESSSDSFHATSEPQFKSSIEDLRKEDYNLSSSLKHDDSVESDIEQEKTVMEKKDDDDDVFLPTTDFDKVYGIKKEGEGYVLGNVKIQFKNNDIIVGNKKIPRTPGLVELIVLRKPQNYSTEDKQAYRRILEASRAHLNKDGRLKKHAVSWKYKHIISDMFSGASSQRFGQGLLPRFKIAQKHSRMNYVYWDDPNELVERLQLLISERSAGNYNHENEIHLIVKELPEGNYKTDGTAWN